MNGSRIDLSGPEPTSRSMAAREVEESRTACETDGCAVLASVGLCLEHQLPPPPWLVEAFLSRMASVTQAFALDWSSPEAFGSYWPPRTRLETARRHIRLKQLIHGIVWRRVMTDPACSVGRLLFDEVGMEDGIYVSGAQAEKLYYEALADGRPNPVTHRKAGAAEVGRAILCQAEKAEDESNSSVSIVNA